jgi:hypothetical protein
VRRNLSPTRHIQPAASKSDKAAAVGASPCTETGDQLAKIHRGVAERENDLGLDGTAMVALLNYVHQKSSMNCLSQREIAEIIGKEFPAFADIEHSTVGRWLGAKWKSFQNAPAPDFRQHFDVWSFATADKDAGAQSYFGAVAAAPSGSACGVTVIWRGFIYPARQA